MCVHGLKHGVVRDGVITKKMSVKNGTLTDGQNDNDVFINE